MRRRIGKDADLDDRADAEPTDSSPRTNRGSSSYCLNEFEADSLLYRLGSLFRALVVAQIHPPAADKPMRLVEVVLLLATLFLVAASQFLVYGYGYLCASRNLVKSGDVATVRLFTVFDRDGRVVEPGKIVLHVHNLVSS